MKKLIFLFLFISSFQVIGQNISPENRIVVIGMAEIEIPADKVMFQVKLSYKDDDVKKAFALHKESESKLISFLKDLKVSEKNINYTLVNVGKKYSYYEEQNAKKIMYATNQTVTITLDSIRAYSDFMLKLISSGFNDIETDFISSKTDNFHDVLIKKAIEMATLKAQIMSKSSKRNLGKILKVSDTDDEDPDFSYRGMVNGEVASSSRKGWITNAGAGGSAADIDISLIPQTIKKSMSVKVIFELK
jgi:uncharacterized protein YggE